MSYIKRAWEDYLDSHIDEMSDEDLLKLGYSKEDIEHMRYCYGKEKV